ncbi:stage V sporulation protein AD [Cerasibacillus quisquiliarum]|uniref:Stage V sporulation protein AD n=1 Tax=Cerasibacillus quisquiliarum TaxID=227865 RepID=A0A511UZR6_9BACI|nr:stage V sporulation protein AD [Cerasibacillus quisquiliarum]GEN30602.1 stage V sporulation protein AD [Cerasibacillus quisquiliarum]
MLLGKRTWMFTNKPVIISTGTVGGPMEAKGKIADSFDLLHDDQWLEQASFEKAQQLLLEQAIDITINKSPIEEEQVEFFLGGDLINQITPTTLALNSKDLGYFGLFNACATSTEGLALAALMVNNQAANYVITGTASHNAATERQYRYPTEYGSQKPPTAQWTVTGAGCALIAQEGTGPVITSATIGKVIDMGLTDPFNMGGAMAPAAVDTIMTHLKERNLSPSYYDLIITGDLGKVGRESSLELLNQKGIHIRKEQYVDCGLSIYKREQPILAGASGTAASAVAIYGYYLDQIKKGKIKKILAVATGSLHSPLTVQQKNSIPCIAHAVAIEAGSDKL